MGRTNVDTQNTDPTQRIEMSKTPINPPYLKPPEPALTTLWEIYIIRKYRLYFNKYFQNIELY